MSDRADQHKFVRRLQREVAEKERELAELKALLANAESELLDAAKKAHGIHD